MIGPLKSRTIAGGAIAAWLAALASADGRSRAQSAEPPSAEVRFDRDVRPILSEHCLRCHGPDQARRKADLRLDTVEGLLGDRDDDRVVAPGDPTASELYRRITSDDETERMPPPGKGKALTSEQTALVRRWIEQGASWEPHWALVPLSRPRAARVKNPDWVRNPIDGYVLERLEKEGLAPSVEADPTTLLRRMTLDLTGVPPSPDEVDAFLADDAPAAYERAVDRLLASPRYGERMAVPWLDAARYADTNGYQSDGERFMWRWRDWVIDAYNANMPFDQFTVEQLAGDLLPNPTPDQIIATGFNRNHRGNAEGGIIPEEYAVEYVVDRVDTTATVWLGLTLGCARCHDHKFDPITQREFYQVYAFFNNVPERGRAVKYGNSPPVFPSPTRDQRARLGDLDRKLVNAEAAFDAIRPALTTSRANWERTVPATEGADWSITRALDARFSFEPGESAGTLRNASAASPAGYGPGRLGRCVALDGSAFVDGGDVGGFGFYDKFSIAAWVNPEDAQAGPIVSRMGAAERSDGYAVVIEEGKIQVHLTKRWLDDALRVETIRPVPLNRWSHVVVGYDGSRTALGVKIHIDGKEEPLHILLDELNQSFESKAPFLVGAGGPARFRGRIDEVRVHHDVLSPEEVAILSVVEPPGAIAAIPVEARTPAQVAKLETYHVSSVAPEESRAAWRRIQTLREERDRLVESFPTTMVMSERPEPRPTYVLTRGEYDKPGEQVQPGVPACFPRLPADAKADRLGFARWLVDPSNPLTARVAVNRDWQRIFGTGLVRTAEDFGTQGTPPSHPELLDWLASEFIESGWDVKALQRLIVTCATYRQSSVIDPERSPSDPENRLLGRGPRLRLPAEMIRDGALAAAGLLVERVGGPSVKPYQPAGLWKELSDTDYPQDHGPDLYRRSLYTFWKRTVPPPVMATFDAPGREACSVRLVRTDTPLQALTMMNDVTFVEAARGLAARAIREGGGTDEGRLSLAFRLATARRPEPQELRVLRNALHAHRDHFRTRLPAARELLAVGESPRDEALDPVEHAAHTAVANLILSLDETITRE
ncbi:MAG: DUF1553 domain-containing protein [Isosphaeraceae bacterium]